jgi:hypothetical protein
MLNSVRARLTVWYAGVLTPVHSGPRLLHTRRGQGYLLGRVEGGDA